MAALSGQSNRWGRATPFLRAVIVAVLQWPLIFDAAPRAFAQSEPTAAPRTGAIIPISDEITDVTTESLRRRVKSAIDDGANVIIFEIDTPGGYVTSALDICNYIKDLDAVKTVAWIHPHAFSAGSMISVACNEIVMSRASTLGDCGVLLGGPMGPQEVPEQLRAKAESPVLEQFRDSARKNGYDITLCESMVVKEREIYWIENVKTSQRRFVSAKEKDELVGGVASKTKVFGIEVPTLSPSSHEWRLVESYDDPVTGSAVAVEQPVVPTTELLTMSQSRAQAFGFSKAIVNNETELRERYHLVGEIQRSDFIWSEVLTRWLTSMPVRGFLMVIILLGAYVEFHAPGHAVAGIVALIALGIFVGAPYLTGLANVWEILCIVLGVALIAVELFVLPGFGIAGFSGILLLAIGVLGTFMPDEPGQLPIYWPQLEPGLEGLKSGVQTIGAAIGLSIVGMVLMTKYLPQLPYLRGIVPANPTPDQVRVTDPYEGVARLGDIGIVIGGLRPSGKARFGATLVDVVSEGQMVDADAQVEVVERSGYRVVVRPVRRA